MFLQEGYPVQAIENFPVLPLMRCIGLPQNEHFALLRIYPSNDRLVATDEVAVAFG